jgi:hypothetical protein
MSYYAYVYKDKVIIMENDDNEPMFGLFPYYKTKLEALAGLAKRNWDNYLKIGFERKSAELLKIKDKIHKKIVEISKEV